MLESAMFRPQTGYYNSAAEEAAALMESVGNNHPFLDGSNPGSELTLILHVRRERNAHAGRNWD